MERNEACFQAAVEGAVLLKNEGMLPLKKGERVALFGREQFEYLKSGSGSGGDVRAPYVTNLHDELEGKVQIDEEVSSFYHDFIQKNPFNWNGGWPAPSVQVQPKIPEELVEKAAKRSRKAVVVLSRAFGEGFDMKAEKGGFFLSEEEEDCLKKVSARFSSVAVLLNLGNPIDLGFMDRYPVNALMILWYGGQEGGRAGASLLLGEDNPSGKLPITLTHSLEDVSHVPFGDGKRNIHGEDIYVGYRYFETFAPEKVRYPFGFGLSYTNFEISFQKAIWGEDDLSVAASLKNVGTSAGKEAVELYAELPHEELGEPSRVLVAFQKSKLLAPGEEESIVLHAPKRNFAVFDERDDSPFAHSFVLPKGLYTLYLGSDVRSARKVDSFRLEETELYQKCTSALRPQFSFRVLDREGTRLVETGPRMRLPQAKKSLPDTGEKGISFADVAEGKKSVEEFAAQFEAKELGLLLTGEGWSSPKGSVPGSAAVIGGAEEPFASKGVKIVTMCDGPSGLRDQDGLSHVSLPAGICLSASFNPDLIDGLAETVTPELKKAGVDILLGPGTNIIRHPLCGRNFEYFSEDPYLSGTMAATYIRDFEKRGISACVKHFAVNLQENERIGENEVLSERALREIYLRPFEMAKDTGLLDSVMTSFNRINGVSSGSNAELINGVLRGEWGFQGLVMTDWGTFLDDFDSPSRPFSDNNIAAMVRAGGDVYMEKETAQIGRDEMMKSYPAFLSEEQIRQAACHVLRLIAKIERRSLSSQKTK